MSSTLSPVNVILLGDSQLKAKEDMIYEYLDILIKCKKADEFYNCLSMLYDDAVMRTGQLILHKQIQKNCEILEELCK